MVDKHGRDFLAEARKGLWAKACDDFSAKAHGGITAEALLAAAYEVARLRELNIELLGMLNIMVTHTAQDELNGFAFDGAKALILKVVESET